MLKLKLNLNFIPLLFEKNDNFFVEKISTLVLDSLESTHSVSFEVNNAEEVKTLFDEISYNKVNPFIAFANILNFIKIISINYFLKGSSIIRMMYAFLTEDTTKKGLNVIKSKYIICQEFNQKLIAYF